MSAAHQVTVLVTAVGGAGSIEVLRSLNETGRYRLIATDTSLHNAGFAFAERHHVVPFGADPRFEAAIVRVLDQERADFVISTVDEEIPVFHRLAAERYPWLRVVTARAEFCRLMLDKWIGMRALAHAGITVPETWLATDAPPNCYPAIIKPRVGRGSRGVAALDGPAELGAYLAAAENSPDNYIVQRRILGQEYTVSGVTALGGPLLAVVPKQVVLKQGVTRIAVTRVVPVIEDACRALQDQLRADGPFNAQLILTPDGVPTIFEVNPRYSTTTALTIAAGLNEVDVVIQHALGNNTGPLEFCAGLCMIRYTAALYVKESEWPVAERS